VEVEMKFVATVGRVSETVEVTGGDGSYRVTIGDQEWRVDARLGAQGICSLVVDGVSWVADVSDRDGACVVEVAGERYAIDVEEQTRHIIRTRGGALTGEDGHTVRAPMPGRITHVPVAAGDAVAPGDTLVVVEAMKMENELKASVAGTVREVRVQAGQAVNAGDVLVVVG
jgi:biotin carboxyl carrier protein